MDSQNTVKLQVKYHTKNVTIDIIFNQPIACPSDQQAGHVTHRPTIASKHSSQGLSQQLSNLQIRRVFKRNTLILMEETRSKLNSTQKIVVNLLQQLVTECTDQVLATQPCTVASTNWLQSLPTGHTACFTLTGYRACLLPTSTKNHQPKGLLPAGHSSSAAYSPA